MSGAEVVGLVLGGLPLVISGLEHYEEGCRAMKKMLNAEREFQKLRLKLGVESRIFSNSIVEILEQHEFDELDLAASVIQVTDAKRQPLNPCIDACLRRRLCGSYELYVESARSMARAIESLQSSLQLDENGKGPFTADKSSFRVTWSSVKFGMQDKRYERMIADITANSERLRRLAESQLKLTEPTQRPKKFHGSRGLEKAREHARALFPTLQKVMAGKCFVEHTACLYLKPIEAHGNSLCSRDDAALRVIMGHHISGYKPPLRVAQETEVRLVKAVPTVDPDRRDPKRVRFGPMPLDPHRPPEAVKRGNLEEIHDLCGKLQVTQSRQVGREVCLGYVAEAPNSYRHCIYRPRKPFLDDASVMCSLAEILEGQNGYNLGFADKTYLAHALASGMLRLYQTPWLEPQWGKDDIVVFRRRRRIQASHPFVSARVPLGVLEPTASQPLQARYFKPCSSIKEQTLFALGLILIEIALGKSFKDLRPKEPFGPALSPDNPRQQLSDFSAAVGLLDLVEEHAEKRYADVVRRCILCDFGPGTSSLDNVDFRRKVEAGVLLELEQEVMDLDSL